MTPGDVWPLLAFPECEPVLPVYQSEAELGMMFSVVTWLMLTISGLQNWSWKSQEVKIVKESEKRKWHHRRHCEGFSSRSFKNTNGFIHDTKAQTAGVQTYTSVYPWLWGPSLTYSIPRTLKQSQRCYTNMAATAPLTGLWTVWSLSVGFCNRTIWTRGRSTMLSANSWLLYCSQRLFGTIRCKTGALPSWTIC